MTFSRKKERRLSTSPRSGIIALTTDFGRDDAFVGVMKGVIAGINPSARVIDLTHSIPAFDVVQAAFRLRQAYPYFPKGTVHVAIVDPGVGGERRIVAMESDGHLFLAPDNGTLAVVKEERGCAELVSVTEPRFFLTEVSASFHGRDIFAPVAAHLAAGAALSDLGPPAAALEPLQFPRPAFNADGSLEGAVLWADHFGNLVTNLPRALLSQRFSELDARVEVVGQRIERIRRTYSDAAAGELLAMIGSFGMLEIAVRQGDAARTLGAGPGTPVRVRGA
jgi:S-adenosylmethionine hydrolase